MYQLYHTNNYSSDTKITNPIINKLAAVMKSTRVYQIKTYHHSYIKDNKDSEDHDKHLYGLYKYPSCGQIEHGTASNAANDNSGKTSS